MSNLALLAVERPSVRCAPEPERAEVEQFTPGSVGRGAARNPAQELSSFLFASVRLSWWPSGGPGGFSAPPPSRRSGSRPWRISRLPPARRRSTPC